MVRCQSFPILKNLELLSEQVLDRNGILKIVQIIIEPKQTIIWLIKEWHYVINTIY